MSFKILGVAPQLVDLLGSMGIVEPLPIQKLAIPATLRGENILAKSQTGSGKTLAYLLPLVQMLSQRELSNRVSALILSPTRELAQQIGAICAELCATLSLSSAVIVGGVEYELQRQSLASAPNIIIATPGRLIDLLEQGIAVVDQVDFLVVDEVDQMLDLGFREPILSLAQLRSTNAQTLCYSATLPEDVVEISNILIPDSTSLSVEGESLSVEQVEHLGYYVSFEMMDHLLLHLLRGEDFTQSIIFTRSRKMADRVVGLLATNSIVAEAIHSDRSQAAREHILARFRGGETTILVATDVIARGIDIDSVTHVFNFGLPQSAEQYIHRCGRCGRAGRQGRAISIFTPDERGMVDSVCRLMKRHIIIDNSHPYFTSDVGQALDPQKTKRGKKRKR